MFGYLLVPYLMDYRYHTASFLILSAHIWKLCEEPRARENPIHLQQLTFRDVAQIQRP